MANSSAADKHPQARLLNPWALLPVALGVALVLWLTFNSEEVFMPSGDGEPDAVSVNYAELLLQAHPENDALRLTLIDLLVKLGDFEQARHHLARLRGKDRLATPFYEVELDILGALARPEGMDEEQTRRLLERLRKIEHVSLNDAMLERLARHALALDAPDLAARTFAELAGRDPQGRQRWLDEAARWYLASGEPLPAADIQRQLAEAQTEPAKRLAYLRQAFASLLAGERGEQAALLLDERLDALPEDESTLAWLAEGVRAAYERMLALDIRLNSSDEDQLIALYRDSNPKQALQVLIGSWQRSRDPRRLASALQLAENLHDWPALKSLLAEAEGLPEAQGSPYYWVARARLAEQEGHGDVAERLYREALVRFPGENLVRERLLWFYIDRGRRDSLAPLLAQWHGLALRDSTLWLPFASASLLLERNDQALAWFRLYLKSNPSDWLVQAAYADALDASGYQDKALRLRRLLLRRLDREAVRATPDSFAAYLRLLAVAQGPLLAQGEARRAWNGEPAMLQLWFEQFLDQLAATNQEPLKDDWLAWARGRGLKIGRNEEIQAALRSQNRAALQRLLERGELDPAQRVEALVRLGHGGEALGEALGALGDGHSRDNREQLRRQAAEILERTPQGLQLGWNKRDFGGLDFKGPTLRAARHLGDDWYADLELGSGRYHGDALDSSLLGSERNARLTLRRELADGFAAATLDGSWRDDEDRHGLGLLRNWRLSSRDELEAGLDWHRETDETGLMRALGMRDSLRLGGRHTLSGRDQLSWSLAHNRFSTRQGDDLGNGEALSLEWAHTLFFDGPAWQLRGGIDYQRNRLENRVPDDLLAAHGGALALDGARSQDLLQDRYGQVYLGSTWRRGFPGALNRSRPQYTWIVDTLAGWQWTEKEFNYGIDLGIGMELLGDDELAFTFGYQSAPQGGGGDAGGTLGVTYSTRFGR